jgi:hypothetical protein
MKALTAFLIAAANLLVTSPAHTQQPDRGVPAVDCVKSQLSLNPPLMCMLSRGVLMDNRLGNKEFYVAGTLGRTTIYMALAVPPFVGGIKAYSEQQSVGYLKNLNDITRKGRDWSAIKTDGNSSYLTFKTEQEQCIAFDHAGPFKEGGYAWVLRGYLCSAGTAAPSFENVKAYLAATRVGTTRDNLNAYGQPVRPLQSLS